MTGRLFSSRGRRRDRDERERGFLEGERDPEESKGLFGRNFGSVKGWGGGRHAGQRAETELLEICQPTDGNGPDIHTRSFRSEQGRRAVEGERKEATEEEEKRLLSRFPPLRVVPSLLPFLPRSFQRNKASVNSSVPVFARWNSA